MLAHRVETQRDAVLGVAVIDGDELQLVLVLLVVGEAEEAEAAVAAAGDGAAYGTLTDLLASLPGQLLLVGWTAAFFLHLANGIRHLVWDTGRGFGKAQATSSGLPSRSAISA